MPRSDDDDQISLIHCEEAVPESETANQDLKKATYWSLFANHSNFRWFLVSYIVSHIGEWTTYVASMSILGKNMGQDNHLLLSILVVARLAPNTLLSIPGGILADTKDRKWVMFTLDVLSTLVALLFLSALHSVSLLFACTILQETLSGLYEPSRSAIMPQLVPSGYLARANAVTTIAWSLTASVGSSLGGFLVAMYGPVACFLVDACMYAVSAVILLVFVKGNFNVLTKESGSKSETNVVRELFDFLRHSESSPYVLIKTCGSLLFGASDIINVSFSQVEGELDSRRLGYMFGAMGIGCLLGPLVVPDQRSYLKTCIVAYGLVGIGYGLVAMSKFFWLKCAWTILRASGAAILWVDSSIVIQSTVPATILGRVCAVDYGLALMGEAISALMAGILQDKGTSATQVAFILSGVGMVWMVLWSIYYVHKQGRKGKAIEQSMDSVEMMAPLQSADDVNKAVEENK